VELRPTPYIKEINEEGRRVTRKVLVISILKKCNSAYEHT
jgi:hypothetical protein